MTALEWRSTMATWPSQRLKMMRRLMLHELALFLPSLASHEADVKLVYAAPEAGGELSRWRAILCGYVDVHHFMVAHTGVRCSAVDVRSRLTVLLCDVLGFPGPTGST